MKKTICYIAFGGMVGTFFRVMLSNAVTSSSIFPYSTLIANLSGCLLLGLLTGFIVARNVEDFLKAGLGVGLCGSLTTMSTFAFDVHFLLFEETMLWLSVQYILGSLFGGFILVFLGIKMGNRIAAKMISVEKVKE